MGFSNWHAKLLSTEAASATRESQPGWRFLALSKTGNREPDWSIFNHPNNGIPNDSKQESLDHKSTVHM